MRVLVTGGCGFIGSHTCAALAAHDVLAVDDLSIGKREYVTCPVEIADVTDAEAMDSVFAKFRPETVVHMAAQVMVRASMEDPVDDARRNIIGTINVLEAARKHGAKRFIYTSTGGARYGEPERLPLRESDPVRPLSPYGISKHTAEHYVEMYRAVHGLSTLILCFGNVYGPRDDPVKGRVVSVFLDRMLRGERPSINGDGKQTRDFLYVGDVVDVIVRFLGKATPHPLYNLASGEPTSVLQVYDAIEAELRTGLKPEFGPGIAGEVRDNVLDISLARKELGFVPTPFREGIRKTIPWYASRR